MARVGIIFGLLLCGVTFGGLMGTSMKSPAQFVPMMLGIPILFCGVVALNPHRRKSAMQAATAVALVGVIAGGARGVYCFLRLSRGADINLYMLALVVIMSAICAVFVAICLISFAQMRRRKAEGAAALLHTINLHHVAADSPVRDVSSRESA